MLMSKPSPPKTGDNTFEVMVKDADGKPIADADVSVMFFMAAMPTMNMPAMRNAVEAPAREDGMYRGHRPGDDGRPLGRDRHGDARRPGGRPQAVRRVTAK